jgi:hypothetical protein
MGIPTMTKKQFRIVTADTDMQVGTISLDEDYTVEWKSESTVPNEHKKLMDDATVEIYNQKDEITKLRIKINELNNRIRELGG